MRGILPLVAIFTSVTRFHHFKPFLRVRHILTFLSHFYEYATFLPLLANFLWLGYIFTTISHFNKCATF